MKPKLLLIFITIITNGAIAQKESVNYGIKAGLNVDKIAIFPPLQNRTEYYGTGLVAGGMIKIPILISKIQGKVIDSETKESIAGATVLLKGTITAVSSDAEGNFSLAIPDSLLSRKIILVVSTVGYATKEFSIKKENLQFQRDSYMIDLTKNKQ